MTWLGAGGWVALLSKMQSEDVLVRLWVGLGGRFRACGAAGPDVGRFRACGSDGRFRDGGASGLVVRRCHWCLLEMT